MKVVTHILRVNWDKMAGDRPRQPDQHRKFSALNVDFSAAIRSPLSSRRAAHMNVKKGPSSKSGYFTAIDSCSVKTLADRCRHAALALL